MIIRNELFSIADLPFPSDHREIFSEKIPTVTETLTNNSLWSVYHEVKAARKLKSSLGVKHGPDHMYINFFK